MPRFNLRFAIAMITEFAILGALIRFLAGNDQRLWAILVAYCLVMLLVGPAWQTAGHVGRQLRATFSGAKTSAADKPCGQDR